MTPDITVIIPLHEGAATIGDALDSVANQSGVSLEVIVVDDRSTDDGPDVARRHRVAPIVTASNGPGVSAARNTGVSFAGGRSVVFLDDDDLLMPGALAHRLAAQGGRVVAPVILTQHLVRIGDRDLPGRSRVDLGSDPRVAFLRRNQVAIHAGLIPRELLRKPTPFDERLAAYEDWAFWIDLAFAGATFLVLDEADCIYRSRAGGTTPLQRAAADAEIAVIRSTAPMIATIDPHERGPMVRARQRALHDALLWRAALSSREGKFSDSLRDVVGAILADPLASMRLPVRVCRLLLHGHHGREAGWS